MRKPAFCKCENKDADQLRGDREADQRLCLRYMDSTIPLLSKPEIQLDLVGNPEDQFSHNEAHLLLVRLISEICIVSENLCLVCVISELMYL